VKPSDYAKRHGFKGLKHLAEFTETPETTLRDWSVTYPRRFYLMVLGASLARTVDIVKDLERDIC